MRTISTINKTITACVSKLSVWQFLSDNNASNDLKNTIALDVQELLNKLYNAANKNSKYNQYYANFINVYKHQLLQIKAVLKVNNNECQKTNASVSQNTEQSNQQYEQTTTIAKPTNPTLID